MACRISWKADWCGLVKSSGADLDHRLWPTAESRGRERRWISAEKSMMERPTAGSLAAESSLPLRWRETPVLVAARDGGRIAPESAGPRDADASRLSANVVDVGLNPCRLRLCGGGMRSVT
jgi:hypothetical protein